jgi:hypothetical protein
VRRTLTIALSSAVIVAGIAFASLQGMAAQAPAPSKDGKLILYGDLAIFWGPGKDDNCTLKNRYKAGEPVGFRIAAVDPQTGQHIEPDADLVVHLTYAGTTKDVKMRWRATTAQPERTFWVAKWVVPEGAPTGIVRYTVTAKDKYGRTGEYKPFDVDSSQLTIVQ